MNSRARASSDPQTDCSAVSSGVSGTEGWRVIRSLVAMNPRTLKPSAIASAASHFSGLPSGGKRIAQETAPAPSAAWPVASAYSHPGLSLSGQIKIALPWSGDQSVFPTGALAPLIAVVAQIPISTSAWAHFSPSTRMTCSASTMPGKLYSGLGFGVPATPRIRSLGR